MAPRLNSKLLLAVVLAAACCCQCGLGFSFAGRSKGHKFTGTNQLEGKASYRPFPFSLSADISNGYTEEEKNELIAQFNKICNKDGLIGLDDLVKKYSELSSLLQGGEVEISEVEEIFKAIGPAEGKLNSSAFLEFNWKLDDLFEFEEEEVLVEAPAKENEDDGKTKASFEEILALPEIDDLLKEEEISVEEVRGIFDRAAAGGARADPAAVLAEVDALFEYEEKEEEDEEEVEEVPAPPPAPAPAAPAAAPSPASALPDMPAPRGEAAAGRGAGAGGEDVDVDATIDKLLDLVDEVSDNIGIGIDKKDRNRILRLSQKLASAKENYVNQKDVYELADLLAGKWALLYTSSSTVEFNQGLTGLAKTLPGASFKDVSLELKKDGFLQDMKYVETLNTGKEGEGKELEVTVDGTWLLQMVRNVMTGQPAFSLQISPDDIRYSFVKMKADKWKALRPANTLDLAYLDDEIRIMQVQSIPDTIFIFERQ